MSERWPVWWALYRKELGSYFDTPAAYVVTFVGLLISGYLFASPMFLINQAVLSNFVEETTLLFLFFVSAITMRLYAEEYKTGTIEILATLPVGDGEALGAKYLAAMSVISFMLAGTWVYPWTIWILGNPDPGHILGSYLGLWLTAAVLAAAGAWASTLSRNQIVAFIVAFLVCFAFYILGKVRIFMPVALAPVVDFLGLDSHLDNVSRGVLDTRDLLYYASFAGFFLYIAYLNVHLRRLA